ncbi:MAG: cytochrome C oxidase subunit IV family protein [Myxococcota bacterium]
MTEHTHPNYVKVWAVLVVLLLISVFGPFLGIRVVTLITAFGVALVKAYLVAKNFMHVNVEPKFIVYLLGTALAFMMLFFSGSAPDVMEDAGDNWQKPSYHLEGVHATEAGHGASAEGHAHP